MPPSKKLDVSDPADHDKVSSSCLNIQTDLAVSKWDVSVLEQSRSEWILAGPTFVDNLDTQKSACLCRAIGL